MNRTTSLFSWNSIKQYKHSIIGRPHASRHIIINKTPVKSECTSEDVNILDLAMNKLSLDTQENSFTGEFIQLGPNFSDRMLITMDKVPELLNSQVLQKVTTKVFKTSENHDFQRNGFEFSDYRNAALGEAIEAIATGPESYQEIPEENFERHADEVEKAVSSWANKKGMQFEKAVWIDTVYRNTASGKFQPVHFAHADFPEGESGATLQGHSNWKERIMKRMNGINDKEYEKLNISKMLNVWMPLDKEIEAEPLAIMDTQSIQDKSQELRTYKDKRINGGDEYFSVGIMPSKQQRWYIKDKMKRGEVAIFDSCQTPHSAISLPNQGSKGRRSLECRVIILDKQN